MLASWPTLCKSKVAIILNDHSTDKHTSSTLERIKISSKKVYQMYHESYRECFLATTFVLVKCIHSITPQKAKKIFDADKETPHPGLKQGFFILLAIALQVKVARRNG